MLRIVKGTEPLKVDRLNVCLYGGPGLGKTSLAFTAADPLLIDFDHGSHRAAIRKDVVVVDTWKDVTGIAAEDLKPYQTIILDTAGRALDVLTIDVILSNPKMGRGAALTLQGFGELKSRFASWLKLVNSLGKDTVMLAHMDEQRSGDDIVERLDITGGSKAEIYKAADLMGRLTLDQASTRMIDFSPRPFSFGKNPVEFGLIPFPHPRQAPDTLAKIIEAAKEQLNRLTADQQKTQKENAQWESEIKKLSTLEQVNDMLVNVKANAPKPVQAKFNKRAKELGYVFSKERGAYLEGPEDDGLRRKEEAHA